MFDPPHSEQARLPVRAERALHAARAAHRESAVPRERAVAAVTAFELPCSVIKVGHKDGPHPDIVGEPLAEGEDKVEEDIAVHGADVRQERWLFAFALGAVCSLLRRHRHRGVFSLKSAQCVCVGRSALL